MFIVIGDGTSVKTLQAVCEKGGEYNYEEVKECSPGSSICVKGKIVESPVNKENIEMQVEKVEIYGKVVQKDQYPIGKTKLPLEYLRSIPHMRPRTNTFVAISKIKSSIFQATYKFFNENGFTHVDLPVLTENECESGCQTLQVTHLLEKGSVKEIPCKTKDNTKSDTIDFSQDYFGKKVSLTVSAQLHLETYACALSKCFTITRAFRGEKSLTNHHLCEFNMVEWESCFITLKDNIKIAEDYIKYCLKYVIDNNTDDIDFLQNHHKSNLYEKLINVINKPFVITSHHDAILQLQEHVKQGLVTFTHEPLLTDDLAKEHEKYITDKLYDNSIVVVCYFPKAVKAFYMPVIDSSSVPRVDCFDILIPGVGETVGGSMRETDYTILLNRMLELNIDPSCLDFYLDLRKYGTVPHGGAGLGLERLIQFITGMDNIRDVISYPRTYKSCQF